MGSTEQTLSKRGRCLWADPTAAVAGIWAGRGTIQVLRRRAPFRAIIMRRGLAGGLCIYGLRRRERAQDGDLKEYEEQNHHPPSDQAEDKCRGGDWPM